MHFVHPPCLLLFFFSCFASLLLVVSSNDLKKKKKEKKQAKHLMPFSWHQEPLKDSSGLWNQPAVHRVQRFNKFQGSSQGTATLWTATQNQEPFKYFRRLIIDSLTLSGGHFLEAPLDHGLHVHLSVCARACVHAWADCPDGRGAYMDGIRSQQNQSIKARTADFRNLALSSSTYPGVSYKLNPAVTRAAWKEMSRGSRPWKHKSNVAGCVAQGATRWSYWVRSPDTPDGPPIWVDGRKKSPKTVFFLSLDT